MKKLLLSLLLAMSCSTASLFGAVDNKLFVIPVDESGKVVSDGAGGYVGQIEMLPADDTGDVYSLEGVSVPNAAVALYGINSATGMYTFYGLISWAVTPAPANYPSPLVITTEGRTIALPATGTYDFEFYSRDIEGISHHMLVPKPVGEDNSIRYPSQLYLVDSSGNFEVLQGDPETGVYSGRVQVPSSFRISYEPRYNVDAFIFGPVGTSSPVVQLNDSQRQEISYAKGTGAVFDVSPVAKARTGSNIEVSLPEGYIVVSDPLITGVEDITAEPATELQYYTVGGCPVAGTPDSSGIYIVRNGDRVCKTAIVR